jgi:hypothetical protein
MYKLIQFVIGSGLSLVGFFAGCIAAFGENREAMNVVIEYAHEIADVCVQMFNLIIQSL